MIKVNETKFRFPHADGNCLWTVTEKRGRGTWVATIDKSDPDWAGTKQAFTTEQIEQYIAVETFWKKTAEDSDDFYNSLKLGQIVHYNNGFNNYVRCEVTADKQLLPMALVGEWKSYDLPRRYLNGQPCYGHYAQCISEQKTFHPHSSNIFECQRKANDIDPRSLPAIDLNLPPMTPEQQAVADKYVRLDKIQAIVRESVKPDKIDELFQKLKDILNA